MTIKEIKAEIAELKKTDKLHQAVVNDIIEDSSYYVGDDIERIRNRCEDVAHGCSTGVVGSLVYYSQTTAFFKKYENEIKELCIDLMGECGVDSPSDLFRDWDRYDPFARSPHNQNLLAWFAYEEVNNRLLSIVEQY